MKRWDIAIVSSGPANVTTKLEIQPFESAQGSWVRFDEIWQLLADYEATRAINVRLQGEVDRLTVKELKLGVALHAVIEVVQKNSPQWLLADQLIRMMEAPGSAQQAPQPAIDPHTTEGAFHRPYPFKIDNRASPLEPIVPHEHRWAKPHDCGDPKCAATGNVMCLEPNCYARPGADPDGP